MIVNEISLTKEEIIEGNYHFPKESLVLVPTLHALEMIQSRNLNSNRIPLMVCVTSNNIYSGKCRDGKRLHSVVIKLKYDEKNDLFICINPFDCAMKTLWLKDKIEKWN